MTGKELTDQIVANPYESDSLFSQYCEFHYGDDYFGIPNFPARCGRFCIGFMENRKKGHALDLGCAVGRTTFELAREFSRVIGVDLSGRFVGAAEELRTTGRVRYRLRVEGELSTPVERNLSDMGLNEARHRVRFLQGDAASLPEHLTRFDLVFAGNLIDRIPRPRLFLSSLHDRLAPAGLLVLASPYTWLPEFTPREEWLGGYAAEGGDVHTLDGLKEVLGPHFRLLGDPADVPFVIRETARKFQHSIAQVTVWEAR